MESSPKAIRGVVRKLDDFLFGFELGHDQDGAEDLANISGIGDGEVESTAELSC